jgi:hypothetical protein
MVGVDDDGVDDLVDEPATFRRCGGLPDGARVVERRSAATCSN